MKSLFLINNRIRSNEIHSTRLILLLFLMFISIRDINDWKLLGEEKSNDEENEAYDRITVCDIAKETFQRESEKAGLLTGHGQSLCLNMANRKRIAIFPWAPFVLVSVDNSHIPFLREYHKRTTYIM